ncbi:hypothetical protein A3F37_02835 [Candidatus Saccharibacteria bacterium RIFCSPHIGHO2_12_FULL_41_12]|nr:MAG: hypothetical protein A3F37_02835 [Candidatus Saccharibacteria bacterium RIFCSPHIGHO2_12_FULL_41_12]
MDNVRINKGFPNASLDAETTPLDLNKLLIKSSVSTYLFTVETDQWENVEIFKNDIAIIDRSLKPKKGELIAVVSGDQFQLAKFNNQTQPWGVVTATIHRHRAK